MYIQPNSTIILLKGVPLTNSYQHTLYFPTLIEQTQHFLTYEKKTFINQYYQRVNRNTLRIQANADTLYGYNYLSFINEAYSDKIFYAFITNINYINDNTTEVIYEIDVIQSWLFDYNVKSSFIEREHVDDDTVGKHTLLENVETGEYVCNSVYSDPNLHDYVYMMQVTEKTDGTKISCTNFGGVWLVGGAYICEYASQLTDLLTIYANAGKADAVINVYLLPKNIIEYEEGVLEYSGQSSPTSYTLNVEKPTNIDTYTPRNNKLLCFPYQYLILNNNNGVSNNLQYELFTEDTCTFEVKGVPTVGGSVKCTPTNYKFAGKNHLEGIMLGKYPIGSWSKDVYQNWLTQNSLNLAIGIASSIANIGISTGGGTDIAISGLTGVASKLAQIYQHSFTPNSAQGNTNGGDIVSSDKVNSFYFYKMCIKREYAMVIDEYFDMFGYKSNRVKVPNSNHRRYWWYTKTISANIVGNVPQEHLEIIRKCYDNGITFWKNALNVGNYSLDNSII